MIQLSRRNFLGGAIALMGAGGCRSLGVCGPRPNIVFGVISDVHITTPESAEMFIRTLKYFRDRKVDAVMVAGDLTDWGLKSSYRYLADAWYSVFPGDMAPDGRKVEKLFCTGNHDYDGYWYGDMTLDMHVQGYSEDEALVNFGMKKCWEEAFNESFAAVRRRTVKGYDFISAEWKEGKPWNVAADEWFAENGKTLDPKKPFFFFTHYPLGGTTSCSKPNAPAVKALKSMPNAVAFSGHSTTSVPSGKANTPPWRFLRFRTRPFRRATRTVETPARAIPRLQCTSFRHVQTSSAPKDMWCPSSTTAWRSSAATLPQESRPPLRGS